MTDPEVDAQSEVSSTGTDRPERVLVQPAPDSRLESLHALYESKKKAAQRAEQEFNELKSAITAELEAAYSGDGRPSKSYEIPASMYGPQLTVYYKSQEYLPTASIRENLPEVYDAFKQVKKFTEVREAQAGRGGRRR